MDFAPFDTRRYPTLSVRDGYREWADTYKDTVLDLMDVRLLERLREIDWRRTRRAADLACGTGRTVWLVHGGCPSNIESQARNTAGPGRKS